MPRMKSDKKTIVDYLKHGDKRANIPTEELRDFVADQEKTPKVVLYPRDPSLDPQLVWKGKDEQDRQDLAVPAMPVYIQEKIAPQAAIENLRKQASPYACNHKTGRVISLSTSKERNPNFILTYYFGPLQ